LIAFFARLSARYLHHLVPFASSTAFRTKLLHPLVPADNGAFLLQKSGAESPHDLRLCKGIDWWPERDF
jgi:hypothetical protein